VRALLLGALVVLLASLVGAVDPARACSCIPPDPWALLRQSDGAFVGRLVSRGERGDRAVLVFSVEKAVKGAIGSSIEVETPSSSAACGVETPIGTRIGLFLERAGGVWFGTLCAQVSPEDMLAAAVLPTPTGTGPPTLLVGGRFGPARSMVLDARGRTLAYGLGTGGVTYFSACPGGRRVVGMKEAGSALIVTVRELQRMDVVRRQRIARAPYGGVHCASVEGDRLLGFFGSGPDLDRHARLVRYTPGGATTIWQGTAWYTSFWRRWAFVQAFGPSRGTTLIAVDGRTGAIRKLGLVRVDGVYALTPNRSGTRLAGESYAEGSGKPYLLTVDLRRRPLAVRRIPHPGGPVGTDGAVMWLTDDRFALLSREGEALVYTAALRPAGRVTGWNVRDTAAFGGTLYGIRGDATLIEGDPANGHARVLRRLRYPWTLSVIAPATP
jgi:hypothetical protein